MTLPILTNFLIMMVIFSKLQVNQAGEMIMIYGVDKFSFPSGKRFTLLLLIN